ncbi:hypothetical protein [Oceanobacillus saliphilus]|nr:hypothetical protein [Oceanobacillus saliphilus]
MKKFLAGLSLGILLIGGFAFVQETNPVELSMDREPSILKAYSTTVQF